MSFPSTPQASQNMLGLIWSDFLDFLKRDLDFVLKIFKHIVLIIQMILIVENAFYLFCNRKFVLWLIFFF